MPALILDDGAGAGRGVRNRGALRLRIGILLGAVGYAAGLQIVTVLLLRFLTDSMAISAVVAGLLLAVTKLYDAVIDPLIGIASDRTRSRWGRRRPWMLAGAVVLPLSVTALFSLPHLGAMQAGFVVVVLLLVHGTAYSAFVVPYTAIGAEAGGDYHGQSEIMSYRVYGGSLGLLVAATFAPWLLALWGSDPDGHARMGIAIGLIIAFACVTAPGRTSRSG